MLDGPLPEGQPAIGGSIPALADTIAEYREIGLDELIVPDRHLPDGPARQEAMDSILNLVRH